MARAPRPIERAIVRVIRRLVKAAMPL